MRTRSRCTLCGRRDYGGDLLPIDSLSVLAGSEMLRRDRNAEAQRGPNPPISVMNARPFCSSTGPIRRIHLRVRAEYGMYVSERQNWQGRASTEIRTAVEVLPCWDRIETNGFRWRSTLKTLLYPLKKRKGGPVRVRPSAIDHGSRSGESARRNREVVQIHKLSSSESIIRPTEDVS